jgi:hypothetical protein
MTYGFPFLNLSKGFFHKCNQILAAPLRKSLGLGKYSSAVRVLWDFGVPDAHTLFDMSCIRFVNRAHHAMRRGIALPSLAARDIADYGSSKPHSRFSTVVDAFVRLQREYALPALPYTRKQMQVFTSKIATRRFRSNPYLSFNAINLKPDFGVAAYLQHGSKPGVCIRGRCRLGVASTPARLFKIKKRPTAICDHCPVVADMPHILFECPLHTSARARCRQDLLDLYVPVAFTLNLVLGEPPPTDKRLRGETAFLATLHQQCLEITSTFLVAVSHKHFL